MWQAHVSAVVIFDIRLWQTVKFKLQAKKFYFLYYLSYQREINIEQVLKTDIWVDFMFIAYQMQPVSN